VSRETTGNGADTPYNAVADPAMLRSPIGTFCWRPVLKAYSRRSGILVWGVVKSIRCQVIAIISLFDGGRHLFVATSRRLAGRAERRSRVAAGHRVATQPLTVASPAAGLRSRRRDAVGGMRATSEASPPWTRYRVADSYSVDPSGPEP